jgi:hypothetical protein
MAPCPCDGREKLRYPSELLTSPLCFPTLLSVIATIYFVPLSLLYSLGLAHYSVVAGASAAAAAAAAGGAGYFWVKVWKSSVGRSL